MDFCTDRDTISTSTINDARLFSRLFLTAFSLAVILMGIGASGVRACDLSNVFFDPNSLDGGITRDRNTGDFVVTRPIFVPHILRLTADGQVPEFYPGNDLSGATSVIQDITTDDFIVIDVATKSLDRIANFQNVQPIVEDVFVDPWDVTQDRASGDFFVTDIETVYRVTADGVVTTFFSSPFSRFRGIVQDALTGDMIVADAFFRTLTRLPLDGGSQIFAFIPTPTIPSAITQDACTGDFIVLDTAAGKLYRVTASGEVTTIIDGLVASDERAGVVQDTATGDFILNSFGINRVSCDCNGNGINDGCETSATSGLYWTEGGGQRVQRAYAGSGATVDTLASGLGEPEAIAIDANAEQVYWVDKANDKIQRSDWDGSNVEDVLIGLVDPQGMALDPSAGKIYWSELGSSSIKRADFDGGNVETLVPTGVNSVGDIALNVEADKMYWTDYADQVIERANLDGSNIETLVFSSDAGVAFGLALDVAGGKLYWTDALSGSIRRANLDGSDPQTLVSGESSLEGITLDLAAGKMIWTASGEVRRANLTGGNVETLLTGLSDPTDVVLGPISPDCDSNGVPDRCDPDCDVNGTPDACETFADCNLNGVPDACDLRPLLELTQLFAPDGTSTDGNFGGGVALDGDVLMIGAPGEDDPSTADVIDGGVYVYERQPNDSWAFMQKLNTPDIAGNARFGEGIVIDGNTAVIGARTDDTIAVRAGAAFVFVRGLDGQWSQQAKLTASNAGFNDYFGERLAIDGDTVLVGARLEDTGSPNTGSAYVFVRSGTTWLEEAKLTKQAPAQDDWFGFGVGIAGDTIAIGAPRASNGDGQSGSVFIFTRSGGNWTEQQEITPSDGAGGDRFGFNLAFNGEILVVGAVGDDDVADASGSVYVYEDMGGNWTETHKLIAPVGVENDLLGEFVALDGDTILATSRFGVSTLQTGALHGFEWSGSNWSHAYRLVASDHAAGGLFRFPAIDGSTIVVGDIFKDVPFSDNVGAAYVFGRYSADDCNHDGVPDECQFEIVATSEPGLAIPDGSQTGLTDTIVINSAIEITDLNVDLQIAHTFFGDLCVTLTHPSGAPTVQLLARPGADDGFTDCHIGGPYGCAANDPNITLDDEGTDGPAEDACAPFSELPVPPGSYTPFEPLSAFDGMSSAGEWTLNVSDTSGADVGVLTAWTLRFAMNDCNFNGVLDECEPDLDGDGNPDDCNRCSSVVVMLGDVTGNALANGEDIQAFLTVLFDPMAATDAEFCAADANSDLTVDGADIPDLVQLLLLP